MFLFVVCETGGVYKNLEVTLVFFFLIAVRFI